MVRVLSANPSTLYRLSDHGAKEREQKPNRGTGIKQTEQRNGSRMLSAKAQTSSPRCSPFGRFTPFFFSGPLAAPRKWAEEKVHSEPAKSAPPVTTIILIDPYFLFLPLRTSLSFSLFSVGGPPGRVGVWWWRRFVGNVYNRWQSTISISFCCGRCEIYTFLFVAKAKYPWREEG